MFTVTVVADLVWSLIGLVLGFWVGVLYSNRRERSGLPKTISETARMVLGVIILAMIVITVTTLLSTARTQANNSAALQRAVKCQNDFNTKYGKIISKNFEAQRNFLASFRNAGPVSSEQRLKAYNDYFATIQPIPESSPCSV